MRGNNIKNNSVSGISLYYSDNNNVTNNNINNSGQNLGVRYSNNNKLNDNEINNGDYGLYVYYASNNEFIRNNANVTTYGVYILNSSDNSVKDCSVSGSWGVYTLQNSLNNSFVNCSYSSEYVEAGSEFFRKWYYRAYVNDSNGNAVNNAEVIGDNKNGELVFSLLTDGTGWTGIGEIIEYSNTGTKDYYSDYRIIGSNGSDTDSHYFNATLNINKLDDVFTLNAIPNDAEKYFVKDGIGNPVAWFGIDGNIVLKGSCFTGACSPPADSFIIKNGTNTVAYIDSNGDLCLETGDCSGNSGSCSVSDAFKIVNGSDVVSYIDSNGDLCLTGGLFEEVGL